MRYSLTLALLPLLATVTKAQQDTAKRAGGPLSHGQTLLVVHFDINRADIRPRDSAALDSMITSCGTSQRPGGPWTTFRLAGHTDNSGSDAHNHRLSLQRARAVRDYLRSQNWPDSLILSMDGYGSSHPLNDNSTEDKRSLNRRVEIIIQHPILDAQDAPHPDTAIIIPDNSSTVDDPNTTIYKTPPSLAEIFKDTANLVGKNIVLRNVNFYGDRHVPLPGSTIVLLQLAAIMKEYPTLHIEIQGYVCCMPDGFDGRDADTRTPDLSNQRAKFVYDFLVNQGIKKKRMTYKGFGASNKIYPEERDETQRTGNRRVEIKIVKL
ncbi:MAG TPA: OmpA family protein [Puia sp.]